jgi:hypothetical protein
MPPKSGHLAAVQYRSPGAVVCRASLPDSASAASEISSVEHAAGRNANAFNDIANLTGQMPSRAKELKVRVNTFFNRVRAA